MLNKVILMGRLTRDVELINTPQGTSTCNFTLAVDRNFVKEGEERKTDFINCVAWRQTAEFLSKYFRKGSLLALEGSIQTRSWEDDEKKMRYVTEVIVSQVYFADSKKDGQSNVDEASPLPIPDGFAPMGADDDLPF